MNVRHCLLIAFALVLTAPAYSQISSDLSGASLQAQLRQDFLTSTVLSYDEARDKLFGEIDRRSDGTVVGVYSSYTVTVPLGEDPSTAAFNQDMNTEHTWPQSKGASGNARADLHHLFPVNSSVNSSRSNHAFGTVADGDTDRWLCASGITETRPSGDVSVCSKNDLDADRFEVPDAHKGNVARAMFYFYTMYSAQADAEDPTFFGLQRDILYQWHKLDPADAAEVARSEHIATFQGGKTNPFVSDSSLIFRAYFTPDSGGGPVVDGGGSGSLADQVWINEFHYDNASSDTGEFVEVVAPAGFDISSITLTLYNGNGGRPYGSSHPLSSFEVSSTTDGFIFYTLRLPSNGLQNGAPDGLALDQGGSVFQFLSYEGVITAAEGPATGMTSTDVGVAESSSTPAGHSLQLAGSGTRYSDFTWQGAQEDTDGALNTGQSFVNAAPVAVNDQVETQEDTPFNFDVLGNDSDPEGVALTVTAVTQPANGTSGIEGDGTIRYAPSEHFNGTDTFTYTLSDGTNEATGQVMVTVVAVDDPPSAVAVATNPSFPLTLAGAPAAPIVFSWPASTDIDSSPIAYKIDFSLQPVFSNLIFAQETGQDTSYSTTFGALATLLEGSGLTSGGSLTFYARVTATAGEVAVPGEAFEATVMRGEFDSEALIASTDAFTLDEDMSLLLDVLANDQIPGGRTVTLSVTRQAQHGSAQVQGDSLFSYTPAPNYFGADTLTYEVFDGNSRVTADVVLTVNPVNDLPPKPSTFRVTLAEGTNPDLIAPPLVLDQSRDTRFTIDWQTNPDVDGDEVIQKFSMGQDSLLSTLIAEKDTTTSYESSLGDFADLLATFGLNRGDTMTVYIQVEAKAGGESTKSDIFAMDVIRGRFVLEPEDTVFATAPDVFTVFEDSVSFLDVLANDQANTGERVFILDATIDTTQGAWVRVQGDTLIAYRPMPNFNGRTGFAYSAFSSTDSVWTGSSVLTVLVEIDVLPVDDPPSATFAFAPSDSVTIAGQSSDPFTLSWLPSQDIEGDAITYRFEMGTDSLKASWFTAEMGDATTYATTMGELAALLDANGVSGGSSVDLYTRVHSVTDSATTVGPVTKMTVTRGALVSTEHEEVPQELAVSAAYPNPFNQTIHFDVVVPQPTHVQLKLYDALGREVAVMVDRILASGTHPVVLERSDLPAGVYVYRLVGGEKTETGLVMRVR